MISTSSILAAIDAAEAEVGTRLFDRFPAKGIRITPAGARFIAAATRMLVAENEFARATGDISTRLPKPLRIGCFGPLGTLLMPHLLRRFTTGEPATEIILMEGDQNDLRNWLVAGEIEFAVLYEGEIIASFSPTPICRIPPHVAMSTEDPLAGEPAVHLDDIARRPLVLLDQPETAPQLLAIFRIFAEMPPISFRARTYGAALAAVAEGFGVSILNLKPLSRLDTDHSSVVRKPIFEELPAAKLVVADLYGEEKPAFLCDFIEVFREYVREIGPTGFSITMPERREGLLLT